MARRRNTTEETRRQRRRREREEERKRSDELFDLFDLERGRRKDRRFVRRELRDEKRRANIDEGFSRLQELGIVDENREVIEQPKKSLFGLRKDRPSVFKSMTPEENQALLEKQQADIQSKRGVDKPAQLQKTNISQNIAERNPFFEPTEKVRVRDFARELPDQFVNVARFATGIAQDIARNLLLVTDATIGGGGGVDIENRIGEILTGVEAGETITFESQGREIAEIVGKGESISPVGAMFIGSIFAGLDAVPGGGQGAKGAFKAISKLDDVGDITKVLKETFPNLSDEVIETIAPRLKEVTDVKEVEDLVKKAGVASKTDEIVEAVEQATPQRAQAEDTVRVVADQPELRVKVPDEINIPNARRIAEEGVGLRASSAIGKSTSGRDLAAEITENVKRFNAEKIADEDIAKFREQQLLGPETIDEIIARKRGVITDAEALKRASQVKGTLDDVLNIPKGTAPTTEQLTAVEQILDTERRINKKLREILSEGTGMAQTAEERTLIRRLFPDLADAGDGVLLTRALEEHTLKLKQAEIINLGLRAETGRTLAGMRKLISGVDRRMRVVFNRIKNKPEFEQQAIIEQIAKFDIEDDKEFIKFLDKLDKSHFLDKFAEWATAAKLWNPTTHLVNFGGNTLRQAIDLGIMTVLQPKTAKADWMGAMSGIRQGLKNSLKAMTNEGYARQLSKYVEEGGETPAIKGLLGRVVRTPFQALGASDELFKAVAYNRSMYRQAYRMARKEGLRGKELEVRMAELLKRPSFDMMDEATAQAKKMTFQEDMDDLTRKVNDLRTPAKFDSLGAKSGATLLRLFLPFLKTPTNLFKQAVDFAPVLGGIKNFKKLKKAAKAGNNEAVARIVGEQIIGTALTGFVVHKFLNGEITGSAPKNAAERQQFYAEGKLPYAIKVGNKWIQYKRIDPLSTVVGLVADTAELKKSQDFNAGSLVSMVANNLQDKTYLKGISDLMALLGGDPWEQENVMKNLLVGSTLPSFLGHTARTVDPVIRERETLGDAFKSQIPGLSQTLPAKVDVVGNTIERANKGLNYFFNPIQSQSATSDPVIMTLMNENITISVPSSSFTRDKVPYKLNGNDYEAYSRYVGQEVYTGILDLIDKPSFKRKDQEAKEKAIKKIRSKAMDEWKDAYAGGRPLPGSSSSSALDKDAIFEQITGASSGRRGRVLSETEKDDIFNSITGN